jgi:hypothetical protein
MNKARVTSLLLAGLVTASCVLAGCGNNESDDPMDGAPDPAATANKPILNGGTPPGGVISQGGGPSTAPLPGNKGK